MTFCKMQPLLFPISPVSLVSPVSYWLLILWRCPLIGRDSGNFGSVTLLLLQSILDLALLWCKVRLQKP